MNYDRHCMRIVYYSLFELKQIEIEETRRASKYTLLGSYTAQKLWIIKNWNPLKYFEAWQWCRHSILYSRLSGEVWRYCIESVSSQFLRSEWVDRGVEQWWADQLSAPCPAPSSSQCWADSLTYNIIKTISDQQEKIKTIIISISGFCFQEELVFQFLQRINKRETGITGDISHHWDNIIDMIHWDLSHYPAGARPQPTWDHQHKYYFISNLRNTELVTTVWAKTKIFLKDPVLSSLLVFPAHLKCW